MWCVFALGLLSCCSFCSHHFLILVVVGNQTMELACAWGIFQEIEFKCQPWETELVMATLWWARSLFSWWHCADEPLSISDPSSALLCQLLVPEGWIQPRTSACSFNQSMGSTSKSESQRERLRHCFLALEPDLWLELWPYPVPNLAAQFPVLILLGLGVLLAADFWVSHHLLVCTSIPTPLK